MVWYQPKFPSGAMERPWGDKGAVEGRSKREIGDNKGRKRGEKGAKKAALSLNK